MFGPGDEPGMVQGITDGISRVVSKRLSNSALEDHALRPNETLAVLRM